jgi:hypothetical protein
MSFLTRYGTQFGAIPMTAGNVWWVAPSTSYTVAGNTYHADGGNTGLSPESAFSTLAQAVSAATANNGDVIALLPGTHTTASALAVSKAGLTFVGLPYLPTDSDDYTVPKATITGTGAIAVAVSAADCEFHNIRFVPVTQFQAVTYTAAANNLTFKNCMIDLKTATAHANTKGITGVAATTAPRNLRFLNCYMEQANAGTTNGYAIDVGAAINFVIAKCLILNHGSNASATAWSTAVKINDNAYGIVRDNIVQSTAVGVGITKVFEGVTHTAAGAVMFLRNVTTVQTSCLLIDDFAAADVDLCLNYVSTVAGGTGGTLITAST